MKVEPCIVECIEDILDKVGEREETSAPDSEASLLLSDLTRAVAVRLETEAMCLDAMRLTIKRFFNHHKAFYRLATHYMKNHTLEVSLYFCILRNCNRIISVHNLV